MSETEIIAVETNGKAPKLATSPATGKATKKAPKTTGKAKPSVIASKANGKASAAAKKEPRGPSGTQLAALKVLAKSNPIALTREEISTKLKGVFIGGTIMGHADPAKLMPTSLVGRKLCKFAGSENETGNAVYYALTAAGKALAAKS